MKVCPRTQLIKLILRCELHGDKRGRHLDQVTQSNEQIANGAEELEYQERVFLCACCLQRRPQLPSSATVRRGRL